MVCPANSALLVEAFGRSNPVDQTVANPAPPELTSVVLTTTAVTADGAIPRFDSWVATLVPPIGSTDSAVLSARRANPRFGGNSGRVSSTRVGVIGTNFEAGSVSVDDSPATGVSTTPFAAAGEVGFAVATSVRPTAAVANAVSSGRRRGGRRPGSRIGRTLGGSMPTLDPLDRIETDLWSEAPDWCLPRVSNPEPMD